MKGVYKCRLCGETFHRGNMSKRMAHTTMFDLVLRHDVNRKFYTCASEMEIHSCKDGSFGYGDFLGFKMTENDRKDNGNDYSRN